MRLRTTHPDYETHKSDRRFFTTVFVLLCIIIAVAAGTLVLVFS